MQKNGKFLNTLVKFSYRVKKQNMHLNDAYADTHNLIFEMSFLLHPLGDST
jgi:hypothetical protein